MGSIADQIERLPWRVLQPVMELSRGAGKSLQKEDCVSIGCDLETPAITVIVLRAVSVVAQRVVWLHNEALKRGDILAKVP